MGNWFDCRCWAALTVSRVIALPYVVSVLKPLASSTEYSHKSSGKMKLSSTIGASGSVTLEGSVFGMACLV